MSMPWTCDALLPTADRYISVKYRRFAPKVHDLQWADAAELVAFMGVVGHRAARWIFQWDVASLAYARFLLDGMGSDVDVVRMVDENNASVTLEDGLGCLAAMKDGGWKQSNAPGIVRMALLELRDRGLSQPEIGVRVGLTTDQVRNICGGHRGLRSGVARRGRAASLLAVG